MPFPNFLEQLPSPGSAPGFAGGQFGGIDEMSGIRNALVQNSLSPAAQQYSQPQQKHGRSFGDILGMLGDAISVGAGGKPWHMMMQAQKRDDERNQQAQSAIQNYLAQADPQLAALVGQAGPEAAMQVYGVIHPKQSDQPSAWREYQLYHNLPADQQSDYRRFRGLTRPQILGSPTTGYGVYDPEGGDGGGNEPVISSQEQYDALPPGTPYRDSQGNRGVKGGGQTASPSGPFPR